MGAAVIGISDAALVRIHALLDQRGKPSAGIKVGVSKFDEVVEKDGVRVLIDPKAVMFLLGTEMDFVEEKLKSGFVFRNPNEKGRCGCGESFHV
jgi:iron-sulfur cluster assembly protein